MRDALLLGLLVWCSSHSPSVHANTCEQREWHETFGDLQNARRLIKKPPALSGVECAAKVLSDLSQPPKAAELLKEYLGLLADAAVVNERLAKQARNESLRADAWKSVLAYRERLAELLAEYPLLDEERRITKNNIKAILAAHEESQGFESLSSFYFELLEKPRSSGQSDLQFLQELGLGGVHFRAWAEAIRSCPEWDGRTRKNDDIRIVCDDACSNHVLLMREFLKELDASSLRLPSRNTMSMPSVEQCETL